MKQTAVEWLNYVSKQRELDKFDWEQAKAMEKQQMKDSSCAYVGGWEDDEFEQYYNKTYKQVTNKN